MDRRDYLIEIIPCRPQGIETAHLGPVPAAAPIDVTAYAELDGLGPVNRAVDRDLAFFKTGDVTLVFDNPDEYFDDLFDPIVMTPTTIWSLRVTRGGIMAFWGALIGKGSIKFNRKDRQCEVTAYGLTKLLDMTSGELVERSFLTAGYTLNGAHAAGATTITLASGAQDYLRGDRIRLRNAANSNAEDVTVKYVTSSTQLRLESALLNAYTTGDPADPLTPFHRMRTISYLVQQLFEAAGVPMADLRLSPSQFKILAPTPISYDGLGTTAALASSPCERNSRVYTMLAGDGAYYQPVDRPDAAWVKEDATLRPWIDWSRYRKQADGAPNIILRHPDNFAAGAVAGREEYEQGIDDRDATTKYLYRASFSGATLRVERNSTTDGTTWGGWAVFDSLVTGGAGQVLSCDFDQVRGQVWVSTSFAGVNVYCYDVGGATWTTVVSGGATTNTGLGMRYIPEADYMLASYQTTTGTLHFVAYRDKAILWDRDPGLPRYVTYGLEATGAAIGGGEYLTYRARYVSGRIYLVAVYDKAVCLVSSADDFVTAVIPKVKEGSVYAGNCFPGRVNGNYYFWLYSTATIIDRSYWIASPCYAGVIEYADFAGLSIAEGLKKLAVITNALFWVDDDLAGHFVARDLYDAGAVTAIDDLVLERDDDLLWDQTAQYVRVSGNGFEATDGDAGFASEGIELESAFIPCAAFAQALADSYYGFYSAARMWTECPVFDADGRIFRPLDRVSLDGIRYLVYESDHDLAGDEVKLSLLEDR